MNKFGKIESMAELYLAARKMETQFPLYPSEPSICLHIAKKSPLRIIGKHDQKNK